MEGYSGEIRIFAGKFEPKDWMFCRGQSLHVNKHLNLFSLIGTRFGGDGHNFFCLPDFSWRLPVGQGTGTGLSPRMLGHSFGNFSERISWDQIPPHTHTATVSAPTYSGSASQRCFKGFGPGFTDPENRYPGPAPSTAPIYHDTENAGMGAVDIQVTKTGDYKTDVGYTESSSEFGPFQPALALNFIICVEGNWPPRP